MIEEDNRESERIKRKAKKEGDRKRTGDTGRGRKAEKGPGGDRQRKGDR